MRFFSRLASMGVLLLMCGCGNFFVKEVTGTGSGTTTPSAFLYVTNANASAAGIAGFSVTGTTLGTLPNSPYQAPAIPSAIAITPGNTFVYVGGATGAIYVYVLNSDGSLTLGNSASPVATSIAPAAMAVDSTGTWLLAADSNSATLAIFQIDATNGVLKAASNSALTLNAGVPNHLVITPNNQFVYVSLGLTGLSPGGVNIVNFNATTGLLSNPRLLRPLSSVASDVGLAVNPAGTYLFVGETAGNGLRALGIAADGSLSEVAGSPFATQLGPASIVVDNSSTHVYVANRNSNSISGFTIGTAGLLTPLAGSPYTTGTTPFSMTIDSTKGYLAVVCAGGSPDLQLFSFDSTTPGKLISAATSNTGTDPTVAVSIAATH